MAKQKRNKLAVLIKPHLLGVIIGATFSALLAILIWLFAYFGWTNLALPQRFEYERFDHLVKSNLPENYTYSTYDIKLRMNGGDSILVIGQNKGLWDYKTDNRSDIVLIIDKTKDEYKVSYKFEANNYVQDIPNHTDIYKRPQHVQDVKQGDISGDGREEIVLGWATLGINWSPPAVMILTSDGRDISALGIDEYQPVKNTFTYAIVPLENQYTKTTINTITTTFFDIKDNRLAMINRTDKECNGCTDKAIYSVQFFSIFDGKISHSYGNVEDIAGFENIKEFLSK